MQPPRAAFRYLMQHVWVARDKRNERHDCAAGVRSVQSQIRPRCWLQCAGPGKRRRVCSAHTHACMHSSARALVVRYSGLDCCAMVRCGAIGLPAYGAHAVYADADASVVARREVVLPQPELSNPSAHHFTRAQHIEGLIKPSSQAPKDGAAVGCTVGCFSVDSLRCSGTERRAPSKGRAAYSECISVRSSRHGRNRLCSLRVSAAERLRPCLRSGVSLQRRTPVPAVVDNSGAESHCSQSHTTACAHTHALGAHQVTAASGSGASVPATPLSSSAPRLFCKQANTPSEQQTARSNLPTLCRSYARTVGGRCG